MKVLLLVVVLLALSVDAAAQASPGTANEPEAVVVAHKWRRVVRNPALDEDPMRANDEQRALLNAQIETSRQNEIRRRQGQNALPPPRLVQSSRVADSVYVNYVYEIKISNTGLKPIRALVWEYVIFDPDTQREVGHRKFTSEVGIQPGKSKSLTERDAYPPSNVVDAPNAGRESPGRYSEKVVIHHIEYADGSVWQRTHN